MGSLQGRIRIGGGSGGKGTCLLLHKPMGPFQTRRTEINKKLGFYIELRILFIMVNDLMMTMDF